MSDLSVTERIDELVQDAQDDFRDTLSELASRTYYMQDDPAIESNLKDLEQYCRTVYKDHSDRDDIKSFMIEPSLEIKNDQYMLSFKAHAIAPSFKILDSYSNGEGYSIQTINGDLVTSFMQEADQLRTALGRPDEDSEWDGAVKRCAAQLLTLTPSKARFSTFSALLRNYARNPEGNSDEAVKPVLSISVYAQYQPGTDRLRWKLTCKEKLPPQSAWLISRSFGSPEAIRLEPSPASSDMQWSRAKREANPSAKTKSSEIADHSSLHEGRIDQSDNQAERMGRESPDSSDQPLDYHTFRQDYDLESENYLDYGTSDDNDGAQQLLNDLQSGTMDDGAMDAAFHALRSYIWGGQLA